MAEQRHVQTGAGRSKASNKIIPRADELPIGLMPPTFDVDYVAGAVEPFFLSAGNTGETPTLPMIDLALSKEQAVHIIGHSAPFRQALEKARVLAERDVPVLLQGETGVGKEVFARAIHGSGPRPHGPFVALNCGGLPRDLLASELFGYVEGAFSGARRTGRIGRLEAAHGGPCSSTRSARCRSSCSPRSCACSKTGRSTPWARTGRARWRSGWSRRAIATCTPR